MRRVQILVIFVIHTSLMRPITLIFFILCTTVESVRAISVTVNPYPTNISQSGFTVNWTTNMAGSSYIQYGKTTQLELGVLAGTGGSTTHAVSITGANPAEIYYVKAFSVSGVDTASSSTKVFCTSSNSSGTIKVYFNRPVNNLVANPSSNLAMRLNNAIKDTLAAYIDRAQEKIDIAIYSFDNSTNAAPILQAINNAYSRGVKVRVVYDSGSTNAGISGLNSGIPKIASPLSSTVYTIMHNKFVIIDAEATDPDQSVVWTGSTNWSSAQLNTDANNVIIFQDQALARGYTLEFNEMWGDTGMVPNAANSKFGPDKTDNTPHEYIIGGNRVESYFSPSDNTNSYILGTINTSDVNLFFAMYSFTRSDLASGIAGRANFHSVFAAGIVNDTSSGAYAFTIMAPYLPNRLLIDHLSGLFHHKYMIVDVNNPASDPLVLTGSHNWSTSAATKNDENTVIVHNADVANQYYQEFVQRFVDEGGAMLSVNDENESPVFELAAFPNPASGEFYLTYKCARKTDAVLQLTDISGKVVLEKKLSGNANVNSEVLDVRDLAKGLYFVQVVAGNFGKTTKLIVQ